MDVNDYSKATQVFFDTAKKQLEKMDIQDICNRTGITYDSTLHQFAVPFLGSEARIDAESYSMEWNFQVKSLYHITILHHLIYADGRKPSGDWISLYDAAPTGSTRINQMLQANIPPLIEAFSDDLDVFFSSAAKLGGEKIAADTAEIWILPHIPVRITIWQKDDEFPADARILFDKTLRGQLCAEDLVYAADVVVQALIAASGLEFTFLV